MSDDLRRAFLDAICAEPDEPAHRAAYADWLMERDLWTRETVLRHVLDHPQADGPRLLFADWRECCSDTEWADFIRWQVELSRLEAMEHTCRPSADGFADKGETECAACGAYSARMSLCDDLARLIDTDSFPACLLWSWQVPGCNESDDRAAVGDWTWSGSESNVVVRFCTQHTPTLYALRRGFLAGVEATCQFWLDHGPDIVAQHPVEVVRLADVGADRVGHGLLDGREYLPRHPYLRGESWPWNSVELCTYYETEAEAAAAVGGAALAWARRAAGLT